MGRAKAGTTKQGPPLWMVSFGDMMTLILTFFILLVSMAEKQQKGLLAKGVGSFLVALKSFGLPGMMGESEKLKIFDNVRVRFNLPPEDDPERHEDASDKELLRAEVAEALRPHQELHQPAVAVFAPDSAALRNEALEYVDRLAATLRPAAGQVLILEGHALDAGPAYGHDNLRLAFARADAVRRYLVQRHGFAAKRVEARAWLDELAEDGVGTRMVDARLVAPKNDEHQDPEED